MLRDANIFQEANSIIRPELKENDILKSKALFLEGLINFLTIYAETELCSEIEVNLELISLFINSPEFENVNSYYIKTLDDVYEILEKEILLGLPIWRFLKLSDYLFNILEKRYEKDLIANADYLRKNYPCKRCIFFRELNTPFGYLTECRKNEFSRPENVNWYEITSCKDCISGLDEFDEKKFKDKFSSRIRVKGYFDEFQRKLEKESVSNLDNFEVSLKDLDDSKVSLEEIKDTDRTEAILQDFLIAFSNKRNNSDRKSEYKKAIILSSFINFVNLYIENEIGSNSKVDIYNVLKFLDESEVYENSLFDFHSVDEFYANLTNMIIDEKLNISQFVCDKDF